MQMAESLCALAMIDLSMTLIHMWWHGPLSRLHATRSHHTIPETEVDYALGAVFGPWEPVMGTVTVWANILLLGIPLGPAIFATTTMQAAALWAHTNWWPRWYRHLEWVFITPVSHRLHHSADPTLYDKNCAFVFNWDRLFGNYVRNSIWTVKA